MRGDKQEAYRDYDPEHVHAPVARHETIRMLLAKVAATDLCLEGLDIANAYLYGDMDIPVLMQQPTDSTGILERPGYAVLVYKSLYGGKQCGSIWGTVLHTTLLSWDFRQSHIDSRLYFFTSSDGRYVILVVVVDDMALASNDQPLLDHFKQKFSARFKVKLLGRLKSFIGWEIYRDSSGLYVSQSTYFQKMLREHNLSPLNAVSCPLPLSADLTESHDGDTLLSPRDHARYRSLVGSLMYAAVCTRPDLSFSCSILARAMHKPSIRHLALAKRVVRYVAGTLKRGLFFSASHRSPLIAYSDADWAGCRTTRRSTSGTIITVNGSPIWWSSKRQSLIALSSAEAEYISMSSCANHITWMRRLFLELNMLQPYSASWKLSSTQTFTDSSSAISLATRDQVSERNKHIELKVHHVRELIKNGTLFLAHIPTTQQPADILTKPLGKDRIDYLLNIIGITEQ